MDKVSPQTLEEQRQEIRRIADDASAEINQAIKLIQAAQKHLKSPPADLNALFDIEHSLKDLRTEVWNHSNKRSLNP